jgi:hypothetical protein
MLGKKIEIKIKEKDKKTKKPEEEVKKNKMNLVQEIYQTQGTMLSKRKNLGSLALFDDGQETPDFYRHRTSTLQRQPSNQYEEESMGYPYAKRAKGMGMQPSVYQRGLNEV